MHASGRRLLPLCARSPCGKLRIVGAWLARHVADRVMPHLAAVDRSMPLTSRLGQLQLLRPPLLAVCSSVHRCRLPRQSPCHAVSRARRAAVSVVHLHCVPSRVGAYSLSTLRHGFVSASGPFPLSPSHCRPAADPLFLLRPRAATDFQFTSRTASSLSLPANRTHCASSLAPPCSNWSFSAPPGLKAELGHASWQPTPFPSNSQLIAPPALPHLPPCARGQHSSDELRPILHRSRARGESVLLTTSLLCAFGVVTHRNAAALSCSLPSSWRGRSGASPTDLPRPGSERGSVGEDRSRS
jgi:hypothetical protein